MASDETKAVTVALSGPMTMYESAQIRQALLAAVGQGKNLRLDLEHAGPWDLSGLQLLVAVIASGHKAGLSVRLSQVPEVCREIAERSGLGGWLADAAESFH